MSGILDSRPIGHFKIKVGVSQQNLSQHFRFESIDALCKHLNITENMLQKKKKQIINIHS